MHYVMMEREDFDHVVKLCHRNTLVDQLIQTATPVTNPLLDGMNEDAELEGKEPAPIVYLFNAEVEPEAVIMRTNDPTLLHQLRQEVHTFVEAADVDMDGNPPPWLQGFQLLEERLVEYLTDEE